MRIFCSLLLVLVFAGLRTKSQTIVGSLHALANTMVRLEVFNGLKTYCTDSARADGNGRFALRYAHADFGVGFLTATSQKPFMLILCAEDIELKGISLNQVDSIKITKGRENQQFEQYAKEHPRREQALSAWAFLEKMYGQDPLFSVQQKPVQAIRSEKQRIQQEDEAFLAKLPEASYVKWFLPVRRLVSSVSLLAQHRPEEIPAALASFRAMDYADLRLYRSGLLKEAIESHFWLIENSGRPLDTVFADMKISIDALVQSLVRDEKKLNEITDYLFDLLERHSLFRASEYLALKVLNQNSCTLDQNLAKQLETYRAMKKGNIAPELPLQGEVAGPKGGAIPAKLSDLKSKYTLVVYGASWCPKCREELPEIAGHYAKWKAQGVEVLFISLDEQKEVFEQFAGNFPFLSFCDFRKWESEMAKSYHVFATPTLFLLDQKREILLRPNSVKQMDAWVDWFLVQGHKQ
jgi:peroxiredoxin